jgi:hypothetical protein
MDTMWSENRVPKPGLANTCARTCADAGDG